MILKAQMFMKKFTDYRKYIRIFSSGYFFKFLGFSGSVGNS